MQPLDWKISAEPVSYENAVFLMESRVRAILGGLASEQVWLLEHPALYTAGTSAKSEHLLDRDRFPVFSTGRGGQFTYHGPGQRIAYVMLDLRTRNNDLRAFVSNLENWLIKTLREFGVKGEKRPGQIGVWVNQKSGSYAKIGAIGIRVRRWITFHGISLNIDPDLSHYGGIVPCGIDNGEYTSLKALGIDVQKNQCDQILYDSFYEVFGVS